MKKRLRNRIFAVIGVFALILPLFLVPVSAVTYDGTGWTIEKENGLWVVSFNQLTTGHRLYSMMYYYPSAGRLVSRAQIASQSSVYKGFYLWNTDADYIDRWTAYDIPLFQDYFTNDPPATLATSYADLSGLPLGVEVTVSLEVTGSFSNLTDDFDTISLYDLPKNQKLIYGNTDEFLVPFYGVKLPLTSVRNPAGTGTIFSTSFLSSGTDTINYALHVERYAGFDYSKPLLVLPQITLKFTTDQLEQLIASQKYNAGLTKQIADALKADPDVQREIQNKKEDQSRFEEELSQGLQDMSIPDVSIEVPEVSIDYPDEVFHMMDFIYEIPGVLFLVSLCASLWICGLILFGKREGGK